MTKMISPRSMFTRSLAVLLPVCFVWVFVACISLCASHGAEEAHASGYLAPTKTVNASHDEGCCPITDAPSTVLPERQSLPTSLSGDAQASFTSSILPVSAAIYSNAPRSIPLPASDPPLERLPILRI